METKNETNIKFVGFANQSINGKNVQSSGIHINSDGKDVDVNAFNNGKMYYMHLNNDDISNLLSKPSSIEPLATRLMNDFSLSNDAQLEEKIPTLYLREETPYYINESHKRYSKHKKSKKRRHSNISKSKSKSKSKRKFKRIRNRKINLEPKSHSGTKKTESIDRTIF